MDAREARRLKLLANSEARLARLSGAGKATAAFNSSDENDSLMPTEATQHNSETVLAQARLFNLNEGEIKALNTDMSESSGAPAPVSAPIPASASVSAPAPASTSGSALAPTPVSAPAPSRAPAIAVAEHARPPSASSAAAPPRQPQPQVAMTTAAATKTAARPTFRDRTALRIALAVVLWLVHCLLWLANAYTLAATSASNKTDESAPITGAAAWDTAWVEYAAVLGGSSSALTNDAGPAYWQLPVLATWLVLELTALFATSDTRPTASLVGSAMWVWAHRADLSAVTQDAALLVFLLVLTGVAHRALLALPIV